MSYTLNTESRGAYLYITVTGENSLETVRDYLSEVHEICLRYQCPDVLIVENLSGPSLNTLVIYDLVSRKSAQAAHVIGRMAYVDINPEHNFKAMEFAEDVAVNRGVMVRVFSNIPEAEQWLLSQQ